jgi:hypothetical protein
MLAAPQQVHGLCHSYHDSESGHYSIRHYNVEVVKSLSSPVTAYGNCD